MDEDLRFVKVRLLSVNAERRVMTLQIVDEGSDGADEDAGSDEDVELLSVPGLTARPSLTDTTEAAVLYAGDRPVALALIDKGRAAVVPEEGEARLHGVGASNHTTVVRMRADGSIEITSSNNANITVNAHGTGEVHLNGSALKVAADTDPVDLGSWTHVPASGAGVTPCSLSYTPPGAGAPSTIGAGTSVAGKVAVSSTRKVKVES